MVGIKSVFLKYVYMYIIYFFNQKKMLLVLSIKSLTLTCFLEYDEGYKHSVLIYIYIYIYIHVQSVILHVT